MPDVRVSVLIKPATGSRVWNMCEERVARPRDDFDTVISVTFYCAMAREKRLRSKSTQINDS